MPEALARGRAGRCAAQAGRSIAGRAQSPGGAVRSRCRATHRREPRCPAATRAVLLGNLAQHHRPGHAAASARARAGAAHRCAARASSARPPTASAAISPARCRSREPAGLNARADAGAAAPRLPAAQRRAGARLRTIRARRWRRCAAPSFVVAMSPFRHRALDYAHVLLPIAPFTETAGSFVNTEGPPAELRRAWSRPLGETRPAWKVLRVLGSLLGLSRLRVRQRRGGPGRGAAGRRHSCAAVERCRPR